MNRSPLFLINLNKIIGHTLSALKKARKDSARRMALTYAMQWLNLSRKWAKRGRMDWASLHLGYALQRVTQAKNCPA